MMFQLQVQGLPLNWRAGFAVPFCFYAFISRKSKKKKKKHRKCGRSLVNMFTQTTQGHSLLILTAQGNRCFDLDWIFILKNAAIQVSKGRLKLNGVSKKRHFDILIWFSFQIFKGIHALTETCTFYFHMCLHVCIFNVRLCSFLFAVVNVSLSPRVCAVAALCR